MGGSSYNTVMQVLFKLRPEHNNNNFKVGDCLMVNISRFVPGEDD